MNANKINLQGFYDRKYYRYLQPLLIYFAQRTFVTKSYQVCNQMQGILANSTELFKEDPLLISIEISINGDLRVVKAISFFLQ